MKGMLSRARNSVQREREPFSAGPYRPKIASPGRKSRGNGENVPPDGPLNVPEGISTMKCNMKGPRSSKESLPSSPALPPKPPRPSPARNLSTLGLLHISHGHENGSTTKRKINWDSTTGTSADHSTGLLFVDPSGGDNGVKVIVRVRPMNKKEEAEEATQVVHKMSLTCIAMGDQQFTYDAVAGEESSQQAVFGMVGLPMVENCLAGFNSSIFAYGQTGSGKTHTMWGVMPDTEEFPSNDRGITPRVFERLFARIQQAEINNIDKQLVYQCRCSFLELPCLGELQIYNEQITDLLEPSQRNLMIREDSKTGVYVDSLSEEYVSNVEDVTRLLTKGLAHRRVGVTAMNNESSRSHSVFTCVIESRFKSAGEGVSSVRSSRLNLVDLAGSERQKQTGSAGDRLKEAGNINKSLSQLGNVINLLAEVAQSGKQRHIPYRDSRLTFLLQESLGGNAKLAMICAVSPASSCRKETLSTLRFAQRAKVIQNKAVINEEEANDVNLLREQIRQLKDELTRMKSSNTSDVATGSGWNGWNARRSYNLLRLSLGHPMKHPLIEADDNDEDMEIDDDLADDVSHLSQPTGMELGSPNAENLTKEVVGWASHGDLEAECTLVSQSTARPEGTDDTPNIESPTLGLLEIAKSIPPALEVPAPVLDARLGLPSPTHSHSPKAKDGNMEYKNVLQCGPNSLAENEDVVEFGVTVIPVDGEAGVPSSLRTSRSFTSPSPRDRLAASLQKGLQILDNHQRSSLATQRRSTNVRFSFQNLDLRNSKTSDGGVQAVPTFYPNCSCSSTLVAARSSGIISAFQDSNPNKKARTMDAAVQTSPPKEPTASVELSNLLQVGCNTMLPDSPNNPMEMAGTIHSSTNLAITPRKPDYAQAIESLLAGSIRRERAAEEAMTQQAAEIEQLNRLVRQYKHERECNSMLQQSREDKIARLEALMAGVLPSETFLTEEWGALLHEHKALQEKFDKHPEVTHAKVEMERLLDELDRYKTFCDLGERDVLIQENMDLRNHLQTYLECGMPGAAKHWRFSLTSRAVHESLANLFLPPVTEPASDSASEEPQDEKKWEEERQLLQEKELEWLSLMDEMAAESDKFRQLAEKRKFELDGEKRCAKEMHEALEMAMEGHARLLEQYAELQEKHISLLGKNRKIREGVADLKKLAKQAGVTTTDTRWFECQAEQLVAMRINHELERDVAKDEVLGLQSQLQDTVEAVAAAGELLVRLKEAENAVEMAQDAAAMAGQEANSIRRDMEKLQKKHSVELAALQQQLLETRTQKSQLCPMCVMAERVKFEFTDIDVDTSQAEAHTSKNYLRVVSLPGLLDGRRSWNRSMDGGFAREDDEGSVVGELEDRGLFLDNIDIDEFVDEPF